MPLFISVLFIIACLLGCEERELATKKGEDTGTTTEGSCNLALKFRLYLKNTDKIDVYDLRQIVPSDMLPKEVYSQASNNNLDVIEYNCRLFLGFRTAPSHFASTETEMFILSTEDFVKFEFEKKISMKRDVREPRFLLVKDTLYMYFAVLGTNPIKFEPEGTMVVKRGEDGRWSRPEWVFRDTFIPWRGKIFDGTPTLVGYTGGNNIYSEPTDHLKVFWFKTSNGKTFEPYLRDFPILLKGGASETDIVKYGEGEYIAVSRNELGDEDGWGSKICRITSGSNRKVECKSDPKKYDSPLLFNHKGRIILVGRRNLTETGNYDLNLRELSFVEQRNKYEIEYSFAPKRCSVWEVDPKNLTVKFLVDLPSKGDTCFASYIRLSENHYWIFNYSSPPEGPDYKWIEGQANPTNIYSVILYIP
ncbi:MAG: hypothetical protein N2746_12055 [Deltaproteobacteria bacterium]|nr:hypothetical protein [Deltaproteobacteria bacterium]